ncbi:hypothetical protein FGB62_104g033 [Gracilaria domingensis]|nr:hypothetical protein FGB62_496g01 [Gracilaria domingensis]KAI0556588.1 hypothetical protein FGB62_494g03 [Gracilaria domingensis]KAI0560690.1 hypothetical protein FGB62_104g033 [Gracilaria domingensis]
MGSRRLPWKSWDRNDDHQCDSPYIHGEELLEMSTMNQFAGSPPERGSLMGPAGDRAEAEERDRVSVSAAESVATTATQSMYGITDMADGGEVMTTVWG